jgi:outer membrane protein assembly factor BamB
MNKFLLVVLGTLLIAPARAEAPAKRPDNWPHWRGPLANGTAPRGDPPLKWDSKTNVKWKTPIPGRGASTPIVWGKKVFVLTAIDTRRKAPAKDIPAPREGFIKRTTAPDTYHQFVVLAYDRTNGKELWRRVAAERVPHEGHHPTHSYAAGSPTTDGRYLYASFGSYGVACYDLDGKLQWKHDLGRMETRLGWGEASTPVIHGETLVINCDQEGEGKSFVVALNARTGKPRWKKERPEVTSWATPLVVEHGGKTQVIVSATEKVRSYDLANGKVLWECGGQTVNVIPSPVLRDDAVICVSGYKGAAALAIRLDSKGDVTGTDKVLWTYKRGTPYVPSPVLVGHRLYFTQLNDGLLSCLDARTGKVLLDRKRLPGLRSLYASPVAAAGRLYLVDRDGTTVVVKVGDKAEVLATNKLGEAVDASPAVAGKQLFLRGEKHLYCIEEK